MKNRRELIDLVDWYFSTEAAMRTVRTLMYRGKANLDTYRELSMWAGDVESELRGLCDDKDLESN